MYLPNQAVLDGEKTASVGPLPTSTSVASVASVADPKYDVVTTAEDEAGS